MIALVGFHRAVGFAHKEAGAHGLRAPRSDHHGDLPWLGEERVVRVEIGLLERDLAARMREIPAHRHHAVQPRIAALPFELRGQQALIVFRKVKGGAAGVLANHVAHGHNAQPPPFHGAV